MTTTVRPGSEIARPAPPTNQTHTTSSLSTVTFAQHQPPISTQDEHRNSVAAAGRADRAQPHPRPRRSIPCERADEPPGDHRRQRALRCFAHPRNGAHRERDRVQPAWSIAVRAVTPSREAQLAPHRRADPGSRGRTRGAHRSLDELFYPRPPEDGESLVIVRLVVGLAMLASILLAVVAIRRRDFSSHGAWMTRGYAIALGAGTQVFTMLQWVVVFGPIGAGDELPRTLLMTAGWIINLGVAEYIIRRRPTHRPNRTAAGMGHPRVMEARDVCRGVRQSLSGTRR